MHYLGSHLYPTLTEATHDDDDDTASEDESDEGSEEEEEGDDGTQSDQDTEHAVNVTKKLKVDGDSLKSRRQSVDLDMGISDDEEVDEDEDEDDEDEEDSSEEKVVDYLREKELASRIFERVVASSKAQGLDEAQPDDKVEIAAKDKVPAKDTKSPVKETRTSEIKASAKEVKKPEVAVPSKKSEKGEPVAGTSQEDSLNRTVFVRNLPQEAKVQDLRRQFSDFGEVKSFRLVLHPITK